MTSYYRLLVLFIAVYFGIERPVHAFYIDPGSGALLWQMIVASLLGSLFFFRDFLRRGVALFSSRKPDSSNPSSAKSDDDDDQP